MRATGTSLGNLLFGQTRGRILGVLFGAPDEAFFGRQIARSVDVSTGAVQRELKTLTDAGFILRTQTGNQVFYRANREHPVYSELHALLAKTIGIFHLLSEALEPLATQIQFAFVYGSFARGEESATSDVDLLVIGSVTLDDLLERLTPVEATLRRPVNPSIYSLDELLVKLRDNHHFLSTIQKGNAVFLIGDEHEFRQIR
jgi:predicted nucleotidyltransferase